MPALDVNMILDSGRTVTANETLTHIDVEGGFFGIVRAKFGAMSGASTTCEVYVQQSDDEGANYYLAGKFQQLGPSDDNKMLAIPVYIRRPDTAGEKTRVRIRYVVSGTSPSYVVTRITLSPMLSLGVPATDEELTEGLVSETNAL